MLLSAHSVLSTAHLYQVGAHIANPHCLLKSVNTIDSFRIGNGRNTITGDLLQDDDDDDGEHDKHTAEIFGRLRGLHLDLRADLTPYTLTPSLEQFVALVQSIHEDMFSLESLAISAWDFDHSTWKWLPNKPINNLEIVLSTLAPVLRSLRSLNVSVSPFNILDSTMLPTFLASSPHLKNVSLRGLFGSVEMYESTLAALPEGLESLGLNALNTNELPNHFMHLTRLKHLHTLDLSLYTDFNTSQLCDYLANNTSLTCVRLPRLALNATTMAMLEQRAYRDVQLDLDDWFAGQTKLAVRFHDGVRSLSVRVADKKDGSSMAEAIERSLFDGNSFPSLTALTLSLSYQILLPEVIRLVSTTRSLRLLSLSGLDKDTSESLVHHNPHVGDCNELMEALLEALQENHYNCLEKLSLPFMVSEHNIENTGYFLDDPKIGIQLQWDRVKWSGLSGVQ
ncbi:hypothetical protein SAMD00019534_022890 [Acytostelium subglobosum LB1]|uniref:hypothetical protein n=1 Tax=Acytostelium subglobosum LB1 TaxID=1410327 RepID=UPI0006449CCC|nr:hypothetical protein SAMD00019534_022890 [Acytostelium subglobosum LB1]GAM19114.1 hypothetical protein SAMD00019534_022890 [Acytostelium subglobosum LB1]|eukprot:XP_012757041.1 hypothetical protein SAMD00019534_022890 [Acytostelium subglobosum LB1]